MRSVLVSPLRHNIELLPMVSRSSRISWRWRLICAFHDLRPSLRKHTCSVNPSLRYSCSFATFQTVSLQLDSLDLSRNSLETASFGGRSHRVAVVPPNVELIGTDQTGVEAGDPLPVGAVSFLARVRDGKTCHHNVSHTNAHQRAMCCAYRSSRGSCTEGYPDREAPGGRRGAWTWGSPSRLASGS